MKGVRQCVVQKYYLLVKRQTCIFCVFIPSITRASNQESRRLWCELKSCFSTVLYVRALFLTHIKKQSPWDLEERISFPESVKNQSLIPLPQESLPVDLLADVHLREGNENARSHGRTGTMLEWPPMISPSCLQIHAVKQMSKCLFKKKMFVVHRLNVKELFSF